MAKQLAANLLGLTLAAGAALAADPNVAGAPPPATPQGNGPWLLAVPDNGAYTGAYMEFGETEEDVTLEKIERFAAMVGKKQALVAFGNQWGTGHFPSEQVRLVHNAGAVPLVLWYPWRHPEDKENPKYDIERILAGDWDNYLDAWAREARTFDKPVLVSWAVEMNGDWYAWSGSRHGADTLIPGSEPPRYRGPEIYKQAYRYVVDRVRKAGVKNIGWVFHANIVTMPEKPWNRPAQYYPGPDYADWVAVSAYGKQFPGPEWYSAYQVVAEHYPEIAAIDPTKPILFGEWGIGEYPKHGSKGQFVREAFAIMRELPRLKGAIFWHERWQNADLSYSNLRVNSSLESLTAYREGVADPFWLGEPQYKRAKP